MLVYGGDIHFACIEVQALAKNQFSFNVFIMQLGDRQDLATIAFILDI